MAKEAKNKEKKIKDSTSKKDSNTERLEITKYCKFCQKRTTHKETK